MIYQHPLAYVLGHEGLALLRAAAGGYDREFVEARFAEIETLLAGPLRRANGVTPERLDTADGYRAWSATYDDEPRNGLFDIDEPVTHEIIDPLPTGDALDAAHATWGKRRLGLCVVRHDGQPPETWRILARNAIKLLPWQLAHLGAAPLMSGAVVARVTIWLPLGGTYALTGLSVALVLIRRDRAALHDLVAGTRVSAPGRGAWRVG